VKAEELRNLDADELSGRLKGARRDLFELRFRMAVGQLDNPHHIHRARKEIARILTVVHERQLDSAVQLAYGSAEAIVEAPPLQETPEQVEKASVATATQEVAPETEAEKESSAQDEAAESEQSADSVESPRETAKDEEGSEP
jgi:large subunit ribosomal protein L29